MHCRSSVPSYPLMSPFLRCFSMENLAYKDAQYVPHQFCHLCDGVFGIQRCTTGAFDTCYGRLVTGSNSHSNNVGRVVRDCASVNPSLLRCGYCMHISTATSASLHPAQALKKTLFLVLACFLASDTIEATWLLPYLCISFLLIMQQADELPATDVFVYVVLLTCFLMYVLRVFSKY